MSDDRVFAKCAWRLIPFMGVLYLVSYIDRVNVGFAALTMNRDLGFTPSVYGFGAGLFFASYALFQLPASLVLYRVGARSGVFLILVVWGALSASCAFVRSPVSFYVLRLGLGLAETGFIPVMLLYLTYWFPPSFRARHTAGFQTAIPLAFVVGGPLSGLVLQMDGVAGLHGWQWLFVLEGLPAVLLAFVALKMLPDGPARAQFLSPDEKRFVAARLTAEDRSGHQSPWRALFDPRVFALGLALMGDVAAIYGIQLWLPQIVQGAGFSNLATSFIVPLPFLAAVPAMMWWGRSSDAKGERIWHVALPILVAGAALLAAGAAPNVDFAIFALSIAVIGAIVAIPLANSLPGLFLGGGAAAAGIGLYLSLCNLGGFIGPFVIGVMKERTGDYAAAMSVLGFGCLASATIILALGRVMAARGSTPSVVTP